MSTLAEFLEEEAQRLPARKSQREARQSEWLQAVDRLLATLEQWVKDADRTQILTVERRTGPTYAEAGLGEYRVPVLRIALDDREVEVVPRARNTVASLPLKAGALGKDRPSAGRVDIRGVGGEVVLMRLQRPGLADEWYVYPGTGAVPKLLTRDLFEETLVVFLR